MESDVQESIRVSRIPKPFSIESLISKHSDTRQTSSSPPSPNQRSSPSIDCGLPNISACHPAMLPFPLYNPWIASYLSHHNPERFNQLLHDSTQAPHSTLGLMNPTNYLFAQNRDKLAQYFGATNNSEKLSEMFSDYPGIISDRIGIAGSVMMVGNKGFSGGGEHKENRNLDIESAESCGSDISMRSSPDGSHKNRGEEYS